MLLVNFSKVLPSTKELVTCTPPKPINISLFSFFILCFYFCCDSNSRKKKAAVGFSNLTNDITKHVNKQHQQFSQTKPEAATVTTMTSNAILNKNYYEKCEGEKFEKIKKNFTKHADKMVAHCLLSSSHDKGDDASNKKYSDVIENIRIMDERRTSENNEHCFLSSSNDKSDDARL